MGRPRVRFAYPGYACCPWPTPWLTFRKGDKATFNGTFLRYDDMKRTLWLQNCVQARKPA